VEIFFVANHDSFVLHFLNEDDSKVAIQDKSVFITIDTPQEPDNMELLHTTVGICTLHFIF